MADAHFSKDLDKSAPGRSSVYLLICFSLLIVVIAAANFMNFTLAETPMRIRSINTQKVLGATAAKLRASLLVEAVIISLIAFVVALVIVYLSIEHRSGHFGWCLSVLLRYFISSGFGAERLVWLIAKGQGVAKRAYLLAVRGVIHAADWRGHHVPAELLHLPYRLWL